MNSVCVQCLGCLMLMRLLAARIYNKHLGDEHMGVSPVQEMTLTKRDLTWFSPNWFQTHQLENATRDFCCTVQGFQYADDDDVHWPYMQFKVTAIFHSVAICGCTCSCLRQRTTCRSEMRLLWCLSPRKVTL